MKQLKLPKLSPEDREAICKVIKRVPAVDIVRDSEAVSAFAAFARKGDKYKSITIIERCLPFINMGSVKTDYEVEVMTKVIRYSRDFYS